LGHFKKAQDEISMLDRGWTGQFSEEGEKPPWELAEELPPEEPPEETPGGEPVSGCFVKGTLVATPHGLTLLIRFRSKPRYISFDKMANKLVRQKVMGIHMALKQEVQVLDFGKEKICCTPQHRFYTGHWVPAKKLKIGDSVMSRDGQWKKLHSVCSENHKQPVYNLTLAGIHNYLVGQIGLIVHNVKEADEELTDEEELDDY